MNKFILCLIAAILISACNESTKKRVVETDDLIEAILSKLTLEEKAGQLNLIPIEGEPTEEHLQMIREGKVGSVLKA